MNEKIDKILKDESKFILDPDEFRISKDDFSRILNYFRNSSYKEFQVLFIRDIIRRDQSFIKTKAFMEWTLDNTDILV